MKLFSDEYFMQEAIKQANEAFSKGEVPVGAIIVMDNIIIARAHNMTEQLQDITAHAEILALTSAFQYLGAKYLPDCTLYVTLEPCAMCATALSLAQIGRIVWAAPDPKRGYSLYKPDLLHPKTLVHTHVLSDISAELLKKFFSQKRNLLR